MSRARMQHPEMSMKMRKQPFSHSRQRFNTEDVTFSPNDPTIRWSYTSRARYEMQVRARLLFLGLLTAREQLLSPLYPYRAEMTTSIIRLDNVRLLQRGITSNEEVCVSSLLLGPVTLTRLHTQGAMTPILRSPSHLFAAGVSASFKLRGDELNACSVARIQSNRICTLHRGRRTSVQPAWEASKAAFPCQLVVPSPIGADGHRTGKTMLAGRREQILHGTGPTQT